ncbi:MAG: hypothetical protein KTR21_12390 [Rhodobacteraceae bacterium]|nr:hypothetical protein [Paracoccaceae bacterium]
MVSRILKRVAAAWVAALCFSSVSTPTRAADTGDFAPLFERLTVCQLFHLTPHGYLRVAASRFFTHRWDLAIVEALTRDARRRPPFQIDLRSTVHLQLAHASSYQAATTYAALAEHMRGNGITETSRSALAADASAAYRERLSREDLAGCFVIKWGNRYPDFVAQPMRQATWEAVTALFQPESAVAAFPVTSREQAEIDAGRLIREEIVELRAIRVAAYLFENEFALLRDDKGGFSGNLEDAPVVCTDEATTLWFFLDRLERAGLIKHFETQDGRFVHRRPTLVLPSDHFGVLIGSRRSGEFYAIDSWVEDGGLPPHIASIEDWFDQKERRSIVSIGDAELDDALSQARVSHGDEDGLLTKLRTHLARFAPADQTARPDGRPATCGFHWCGAPPLAAW